jgi:hypothetical protein
MKKEKDEGVAAGQTSLFKYCKTSFVNSSF